MIFLKTVKNIFRDSSRRGFTRLLKNEGRRGFTLLEILVVLAVTTFLTGMVLTYGARSRNQTSLYVEQAKLAQIILRAKSLSVATYNNPNIPCGYGVSVDYDANSYELFSYHPTSCFGLDIKNAGIVKDTLNRYEVLENYTLASGVKLNRNFVDSNATLSIVFFLPPNPETYIWAEDFGFTSNPAIINVGAADGSLYMPIQVTAGGQVGY